MTRRSQGNEEAAIALLEWLQATHPEPKVAAALKDPNYRLVTTTSEKIASRRIPWDAASVEADNSGRELLADAQAELDRQIGLTRVKEQIEAVPRRDADGEDPRGARHEGRPRPST